jgi:hypothetical protein
MALHMKEIQRDLLAEAAKPIADPQGRAGS